MIEIYKIGDGVLVEMPNGKLFGRVVTIIPNYAWSGETKYSIHGKGFTTIASARVITRSSASNAEGGK